MRFYYISTQKVHKFRRMVGFTYHFIVLQNFYNSFYILSVCFYYIYSINLFAVKKDLDKGSEKMASFNYRFGQTNGHLVVGSYPTVISHPIQSFVFFHPRRN